MQFKRFLLKEVGDAPYHLTKYEHAHTQSVDVIYSFHNSENIQYEIDYIGNNLNSFAMSFNEKTKSNKYDAFYATGNGDAYKVFATVKQSLLKFISEYSPEMICFDSVGDNRSKLYSRMISSIKREIPNYDVKITKAKVTTSFYLIKKRVVTEQQLNELADAPYMFTHHKTQHGIQYRFHNSVSSIEVDFDEDDFNDGYILTFSARPVKKDTRGSSSIAIAF